MSELDNKAPAAVAGDELEQAQKEAAASTDIYTHRLRRPFTFEGNTFTELVFDWGSLTANDSLAIESEIEAKGKAVVVPEMSGEYLIRMAARACTTTGENGRRLGVDAFQKLPMGDFNRIRGRARSFLLRWGS